MPCHDSPLALRVRHARSGGVTGVRGRHMSVLFDQPQKTSMATPLPCVRRARRSNRSLGLPAARSPTCGRSFRPAGMWPIPLDMTPEERRGRVEEFKRSMRERAKAQRAEWNAGIVRFGGEGKFAGIGDPILHESYLTAARELLNQNRGHLRQVAIPILFLQRHALELALKHSIRVLIRFREVAGSCAIKEPKALRREHHLERLFRIFDGLLGEEERDRETLALMESLAEEFDRFDKPDIKEEKDRPKYGPSTRARYREDTLPDVLDLSDAQRDLDDVFQRLFARPRDAEAPFGWIAEYEELTHDLGLREYLDGEAEAA